MIGTYCTNFGDARSFTQRLKAAGLETSYTRLFFGCATAVSGRKPPHSGA